MKVIQGLDNLNLPSVPRGVCVGGFDGFHMGHQYLLSQLCSISAERGYESAVVTFEPIPSQYFAPPASPPRRLITADERVTLAASLCCDLMALLEFDEPLMRMGAREFIQQILVEKLNTRLLMASATHTLGFDRAGIDRIKTLCQEFDIEVHQSPVVQLGEVKVSSSEIRQMLWHGRVEEAAGLLGRHYNLTGTVISGRGKGRDLGYPTANLSLPAEKLRPAEGVYAGLAYDESAPQEHCQAYPAAIALGRAPTFGIEDYLVEAHLLTDERPDLVGHTLRLEFIRRLRGQREFASEAALSRQIADDVEQTRHLADSVMRRDSGRPLVCCPLPPRAPKG